MTEKNELTIVKNEIVEAFADADKQQLIRDICAPNCTETEFQLLREMAVATGLNPLMKQIYCYKVTEKSPAVIVAGIHGMRLAAMRTGELEYINVYTEGSIDRNKLKENIIEGDLRGVAIIKRKGHAEMKVECWFEEFCKWTKDGKITKFWVTMPYHMIKKATEAVGHRFVFPDMFAGVYSSEEIETENIKEVQYPESKSTLCEECHEIPYDEDISDRLKDYIDGKRVCKNCGKKLYDEWKKNHDNEKVIDAEFTEKEKEPEEQKKASFGGNHVSETWEKSKDKKAEPEPEKPKEAPKKKQEYKCEDCGADIDKKQATKSQLTTGKPLCEVCQNAFEQDAKREE